MEKESSQGTLITTPLSGVEVSLLSYQDRLKQILDRPNLIEDVCAQLANGGDLITFCENFKIRYSDLSRWITDSPVRLKAFSAAAIAGDEWIRQRILKELGNIALIDLRDAFDENGKLLEPKNWPDSIARALAGVETDEIFAGSGRDRERIGETKKLKLHDKIKALELIGKEKGLFVQKVKMEGTLKLEDLVAGSFEESK